MPRKIVHEIVYPCLYLVAKHAVAAEPFNKNL